MTHMSGRHKDAKGKHKKSEPSSNADLQAPLHLSPLDTPASTTSLAYLPSDLTPPVAALQNISISSPDKNVSQRPEGATATMDAHHDFLGSCATSSPEGPAPDLHQANFQDETPPYSRTETVKGYGRAFSASKRLQQVMGLQAPEPFVRPPEMPKDLEQRFVEGLKEYGYDRKKHKMGLRTVSGEGLEALSGPASMQHRTKMGTERNKMPDIREEKESPVRAVHDGAVGIGVSASLKNKSPVGASGQRVVASMHDTFADASFADRPSVSSESDSASGTDVGEMTSGHLGPYAYGSFGPSSTFAESQPSRPGTSTTASHTIPVSTSDTAAVPAKVGSFAQAVDYGGDYGPISAGYQHPQRSTSLYAVHKRGSGDAPTEPPAAIYKYCSQTGSSGYGNAPQRPGSAPNILFPSPRVQEQSWDTMQTKAGFAPPGFVPGGYAPGIPSGVQAKLPASLLGQQQALKVPHITVESPSPKKMLSSKKRAPSLSTQDLFEPPLVRARAEDTTTGLPTLPAKLEMMWKFRFPGNTHALLTVLLNWSYTMRSMHNRYSHPKGFSNSAAFPWPVNPPVYQQLVSVSFYNTSVQPHQEIRFLGPGDAVEIVYGEVDTFRSPDNLEAFQEQQKQDSKIEAMKKALGMADLGALKGSRHMSSHQRAATGEGRWAYILVKGHRTAGDETPPPHVMIAVHMSAITDSSTCLHTVLPDDHPATTTPSSLAPNPPLRRLSSLQNLAAASRNNLRMHQALRSVSSSELLQGNVASTAPQDGAQTLHRTVLKLGIAGSIPLIEGYRVDVGKFRAWLNAVGRGGGKMVMWRE